MSKAKERACPPLGRELNEDEIRRLSQFFGQLSDPTRLSIVLACLAEPLSVSEIARRTDISQSGISHHLRLLRETGVLRVKREGRHRFYSLADTHVLHVLQDASNHVIEPGHQHSLTTG